MAWQDGAVAAIGLLLGAWLCWRLFSGRRRGCAACAEEHCPLKNPNNPKPKK